MSRSTSRMNSLGDFDVITGPPAPPSLQKPADPMRSNGPARPDTAPEPAKPEPNGGQ
jgi:hypothetical protein